MANPRPYQIDEAFLLQLQGFNRLTMEIRYFMPDSPRIICPNPFIYQLDDRAPDFPMLKGYLSFWEREIHARIESVKFACAKIIAPNEFKTATQLKFLN